MGGQADEPRLVNWVRIGSLWRNGAGRPRGDCPNMKTLIQAAVVTLFAASAAQAQQAVQWTASVGGNGHWYQFVRVPGTITWLVRCTVS